MFLLHDVWGLSWSRQQLICQLGTGITRRLATPRSGADTGTHETWAADRVSTDGLCWQLKAQPECPSEQGRSNIVFSDCLRSYRASCLPSMTRPRFSRGQPQSRCTRGRASGKSSSHACRRDSPSPVGGLLSSSLSREQTFLPWSLGVLWGDAGFDGL